MWRESPKMHTFANVPYAANPVKSTRNEWKPPELDPGGHTQCLHSSDTAESTEYCSSRVQKFPFNVKISARLSFFTPYAFVTPPQDSGTSPHRGLARVFSPGLGGIRLNKRLPPDPPMANEVR